MVRPNIGILNAMIRITAGLSLLAYTTAKMVRKPWRESYWIIAMLAAMKVAEGIVRYCPVTDFINKQTDWLDETEEEKEVTINPS